MVAYHDHILLSLSFFCVYPLLIGLTCADPQKSGRTIATPSKSEGHVAPIAALSTVPLSLPHEGRYRPHLSLREGSENVLRRGR